MSDHLVNGEDDDALAREKSLEVLAAMTDQHSDRDWFKKVLLPTIGKYVEAQLKPLRERIAALEAHGIKFCGVYQRAASYKRGDVVTHDGGMWTAIMEAPIAEIPGKSVAWQLCVKGRDDPRKPTQGSHPPQQERRP
jgi:hypothetical protein